MADYLLRGISKDKNFRFFAVEAKETVQKAIDIHYLSIINSVVLGRLLISGLLMSADLKNENDILTLRIDGDGPVGCVIVTATGKNTVKGYVENPQVELPLENKQFQVAKAIGRGSLSVIKSIGDLQPYIGRINIVSGEIGEDISQYYYQSEQIDTMINLGILIEPDAKIRQAGGIFVQCLPNTPEDKLSILKENIKKLPNLSDFMDMGKNVETILKSHIFKGIDIEFSTKKEVTYSCNCSKDRFYAGIKLLGEKEIKSLIESEESISAECHFCNKKYEFSKEELISMLNTKED
ncbi:MAG: Hsp33 family molecular chaperone HslO [Candidatus Cloacimonetes bacterium]|nr:Hsp33 family molecular chaperone HslO [Candidatus Cloacimonadota bacterium]MDD4155016.1 Hsp33 family molecular chaperone HslO [Candidatus Cloacimonadota bacterium]